MNFLKALFILALNLSAFSATAKYGFIDIGKREIMELRRAHPEFFDRNTSLKEVDQVIRALMTTGYYEKVSAYKQDRDYIIKATQLKVVSEVSVAGNYSITNRHIFSLIDINQGDKFDRKKVVAAGDRLKEFYGQNGFFNAEIEIKFEDQSPTETHIIFKVRENEPCKVKTISVQTENNRLKTTLHKKLKRFLGKPFSDQIVRDVEQTSKDYLSDNRYLQANLRQVRAEYNETKTEASLYYVLDNPFRYEFIIEGNDDSRNSRASLMRAIRDKTYEGASLDPAAESVQKVRNWYLKRGYAHITINSRIKDANDGTTKYVYIEVIEGPRVKIKEIQISGNISRPSTYYAEFIEENSSELIESGYYNRDDLFEAGYKNLTTHLNNQGYLRAKIQPSRIEYINNRSQVIIQVALDEGPLTQVRKISFAGNKSHSPIELLDVVSVKSNSPLRLNELEYSVRLLKKHYFENGFLEMKLLNQNENLVEYNDTGTQANIHFNIHEGPKVIVSSIIIDGNSYTKDYVILREIDFEIGDVLTSNRISESRRRLAELNLFGKVDIRTLEVGTNISQRTVVISVQEQDPGLFKIGFGVTNDDINLSLRGYVANSYTNLGGTARAFTTRLDLASNPETENNETTGRVNLGFYEPFLFSTRTRGRVNTRYSRELATSDTIVEDKKIDFLLEREFSKNFKMIWTLWGLTSRTQTSTDEKDDDTQDIATIGPSFDFNYTNHRWIPTEGKIFRLGIQYSDPAIGSSERVSFLRSDATYSFYIPFGRKRYVWANSIRGGAIGYTGSRSDGGLPISKLFNIGGYTMVRGYGGSRIEEGIPSDRNLNFNETRSQIIDTERASFYLAKTEIRIPISKTVGGVIFYDYGKVEMSIQGNKVENPIGQSAGVGIRINTPVGPVVLDAAWKIDPRPNQKHGARIHFSVGTF